MKTFFIDNNSDEIILFFLGWGMDERPVLPLKSKKDILYIYDYSNLDFDFDYSQYKKVYVISFSAGVSVAAYLNLPNINYSVAINGTYEVCNPEFGLGDDMVKVFESISLTNYLDFRRDYLVNTEEEFDKFNIHAPIRTLKSSMDELKALKTYDFKNMQFSYDKVLISKEDKILTFDKQQKFWGDKLTKINGGHFAFYNFKTLDELL